MVARIIPPKSDLEKASPGPRRIGEINTLERRATAPRGATNEAGAKP